MKIDCKKNHKESGQSLFEVVLAVATVALVTVALVSLSTKGLGTTISSRNKSSATARAGEVSDWLRSQRDAGWDGFMNNIVACSSGVRRCLQSLPSTNDAWGFACSGCSSPVVDSLFEREVSFVCYNVSSNQESVGTVVDCTSANLPTINKVVAAIIISWTDSKGNHDSAVNTVFTNWQLGEVPAPTPTPESVYIALNEGNTEGKSCNQTCPSGYLCTGFGTDSGATNHQGYVYWAMSGGCTIWPSSDYATECDEPFYNSGVICSGHQAQWTYCRCIPN